MKSEKAFRNLATSIRSASAPSVNDQLHPTTDITGYSLPGDHNNEQTSIRDIVQERNSAIKSASNERGPSSAWLASIHRHQLKFNKGYANQLELDRQKDELLKQGSKVKSANRDTSAWLKSREHVLSGIAGLES